MKIKGLTWEQIESSAQAAGYFRLDNRRDHGNYHFFVLRMSTGTPQNCGAYSPHGNVLACTRKRGHDGMCWHRDDQRQIHDTWSNTGKVDPCMRYRKRSFGRMVSGRGPEYGIAVCFHGFRAFMRECFARNPHAVIRTARAAYLGSEDFEEKWPSVGNRNEGSQVYPIQYHEMCDC